MRAWMVLVVLASLSFAGCTDAPADDEEVAPADGGDDQPEEQTFTGMMLTMSAEGAYPFNPTISPARFEVAAGTTVTITYTNNDLNPVVGHDLRISGVEQQTPNLANGESAELTFVVDLEPGEYPYWCTIGNHREQGMEGVMVVT